MPRTEIVMAVLRCDGRICVARRSQAVATARGMWSVVTGYVEPGVDPLSQAFTELREELGLEAPQVHLVCSVAAVPLESPSSRKAFLVHPFLFECEPSAQVELNWEHDEQEWAAPSRLDAPDCVGWQAPLVRDLLLLAGDA